MFVIVDSDKKIRKKLCDLLERERILSVDSVTECVEKICQFRNQIKLIICRGDYLLEIHEKQLIQKICRKLLIDMYPIIGYYTDDDTTIKSDLEKSRSPYKLIRCDERDFNFPERYIKLVKEAYPDLIYDLSKANDLWRRGPETSKVGFVNAREWLKDEGYVEIGEIVEKIEREEQGINLKEVIPAIEEMLKFDLKKDEALEKDYKKLYLEIREKYEQLSKQVQALIDFVKQQ